MHLRTPRSIVISLKKRLDANLGKGYPPRSNSLVGPVRSDSYAGRLGLAILNSMEAKRKKRSVLEDANALKEALSVHCAHLTKEDKCQVAAKALLNSLINKKSSMEEIVKHILPSAAKRTRRQRLTWRTDQSSSCPGPTRRSNVQK
jgi:hypothetical protein